MPDLALDLAAGAPPTGENGVLQVLQDVLATDFSTTDTAAPGDPICTINLTKQSDDSVILLLAEVHGINSGANVNHWVLCQDGAVITRAESVTGIGSTLLSCSPLALITGLAADTYEFTLNGWASAGTLSVAADTNANRGARLVALELLPDA